MHSLEEKILTAHNEGRSALIPFVTAGFPEPHKFWDIIRELDANGADIIEIGVPFSDPVADGPVVEEASLRSLTYNITLKGIIEDLKKYRKEIKAQIVLMGYANPFFQYGFEILAKDAGEAGVNGFIIPDLPFEESEELRKLFKAENISLIPLVGPNTSEERMRLYADISEGYVYVVSIMGTTGAREALPKEVEATLRRAKSIFSIPIALGFGLQRPEQIEAIAEDARPDALVFGSALLKHIDRGESPASFLARWQ